MKKVINLFGGPGIGKSVMSARLYADIATSEGYPCCEYVSEYAKELVWQGRQSELSDQIKVTKEQIKKMAPIYTCDYVITDSPVLLGAAYASKTDAIKVALLIRDFHETLKGHKVINIFLKRERVNYEQRGRNETLDAAINKDNEILSLLKKWEINFQEFSNEDYQGVINHILK